MIRIEPHPLLDARAFETELPRPLGELEPAPWFEELCALDAPAPVERSEDVRAAGRKLLRYGGYRPTGRGKPASEYLVRAVGDGALSSINLAVDACNVVSLASGIPISVVDLDLAREPFSIAIAGEDARYVFNATGQEIDLAGLLCLADADGPCANGVKDSQRTKTHAGTRRTLSVVWGSNQLPDGHVERTTSWYRELLECAGATTAGVALERVDG